MPQIETKMRVEPYTDLSSHLVVDVLVDGRVAGSVQVVKGYHADVEAYMRGEIDTEEMYRRWRTLQRDAIRRLEEED